MPPVWIRRVDTASSIDRLAATQHGVLSRGQALRAGLSDRAIARRVASGHWRVLHAGIYAPAAVPPSWLQRLMAAILRGGPSALASHRSAAALWRLDGVNERPIEISVKAGRSIRGAIVHRRPPADDPGAAVIHGVPSSGIERTLLELAAVVSPMRAGLALDDALRRGRTTLAAMRELLAHSGRKTGVPVLRSLLDARDDRDALLESPLEAAMLRLLRDHGLPLPVPQHPVTEGRDIIARLDFAYPAQRVGIEADGYRWHGGPERWRLDLRRENKLKLLGWTILRFSWEDVHRSPETVSDQIRAALSHRSLSLTYRQGG